MVYLRVGFPLSIGEIISEGVKNGAHLIQALFNQAFR